MSTVHLGHHFFGAGNLGDDFMLAGFLAALGRRCSGLELTCCVPFPLEPLARRFPAVRWLPYTDADRRRCIAECDAWLGLGGSPFQCAVSRWFVDHLDAERRWCAAAGKPMYFLGVGGQDAAAYALPEIGTVCAQAAAIWTRDAVTAERLATAVPTAKVVQAADLAHVFFADAPPPAPAPGRLTAVLNFDYNGWPGLDAALEALAPLPATDRVWLAQETRPLPGAEKWLFERLPVAQRSLWRLATPVMPDSDCRTALSRWPSGEWLLSSRYHATLAGAWAGSRAVVVATNEKLRSAAGECGYPAVAPDAPASRFADALRTSVPPPRERMQRLAVSARRACDEFVAAAGLGAA